MSSTYDSDELFLAANSRSFTQMLKDSGPRFFSCWTRLTTGNFLDRVKLIHADETPTSF